MGFFKSSGRQKPVKTRHKPSTASAASKYQAVEIQFSRGACRAAQDAADARYLCDKAPLLPLADCDRPGACECRYVRHRDRRGDPRRKSEGALPTQSQQTASAERRRDQGRRADELDETGRRRSWFKDV